MVSWWLTKLCDEGKKHCKYKSNEFHWQLADHVKALLVQKGEYITMPLHFLKKSIYFIIRKKALLSAFRNIYHSEGACLWYL